MAMCVSVCMVTVCAAYERVFFFRFVVSISSVLAAIEGSLMSTTHELMCIYNT